MLKATPTAQHVEDGIHDFASLDKGPASLERWLRNQGFQQLPLRIRQIGGIGFPPQRHSHTSSAPFLCFFDSLNHPLSSYYRRGDGFQTRSKLVFDSQYKKC